MFGHHKAKRAKKRLKSEREEFEKAKSDLANDSPERQKEKDDYDRNFVSQKAEQVKEDRKKSYAEGRERAKELFNSNDIPGLDPEKRKALQYEANKGIQRSHQSANRKLLGGQAQHGIVGKGGVGYAQQKDLQKMRMDAERGVTRDLTALDADTKLKNLAALFNLEQGEASQNQLDKQLAMDELKYQEEKKRQRVFEDQFNRLFSRI